MDRVLLSILVMAVTTYLLRMVPFVVFRKKITNRFVSSFLYYMPYAILSSMAFPAILYSTGNVFSAAVGAAVSIVTSFYNKSMIMVAVYSSAATLVIELLVHYLG